MSKRYIFLVFVLVSAIFALLLLPKLYYCSNDKEAKLHYKANTCKNAGPKALLLEAINSHRYIDADELTSIIVGEDPSYTFVDLRDEEQFKKFSLPKAINIPYKTILEEANLTQFDTDDYTFVLFSNETVHSDLVWSLLRRKGFNNFMVLDGGLNDFYAKILNPQKPLETDSKEEQDLYNFRKAAGTYFGLPNPDEFIPEKEIKTVKKVYAPSKTGTTPKKKVIVKPKEPVEEEEEEGC